MNISPDAIQAGLYIARNVASYTPVSVFVCPVLDVAGVIYGGYAGIQAQDAQNNWQKQVVGNLIDIKNIVGVIQATTAVIGVGTVAGVVLSAVNLHQTLKLREDVKQLKLEVKSGFIDLKQALREQGEEINEQIRKVAEDVKFEAHRLTLIQAYGKFQEALMLIKTALSVEDLSIRNITLGNAQLMLSQALADYKNPHLLEQTSAAGHLRRMECAWAIDQTFALTYQLQNQPIAVSDRLAHLQDNIRTDTLIVVERCESKEELDFLFPEITRIHAQDLQVLKCWQNQIDWMQNLSQEDFAELNSFDFNNSEIPISQDQEPEVATVAKLPEELLYEQLQQKSHYLSLRDQLRFLIKPDLRQNHESYISQQAIACGYKALAPSNWQEITDLTVANLYWYFHVKNKIE